MKLYLLVSWLQSNVEFSQICVYWRYQKLRIMTCSYRVFSYFWTGLHMPFYDFKPCKISVEETNLNFPVTIVFSSYFKEILWECGGEEECFVHLNHFDVSNLCNLVYFNSWLHVNIYLRRFRIIKPTFFESKNVSIWKDIWT
jgi:hypothetical protein